MSWADKVPTLSRETLRTLVAWAIGINVDPFGDKFDPPDMPKSVFEKGSPGIIDYAVKNFPDNDASKFWLALNDLDGAPDNHTARAISNAFFESIDWRPGFAIAALRALDTRSDWDSDSILLGLEVGRGILTHPGTVAQIKLKADLAEGGEMDTPLNPRQSPFSNPVVREVLVSFDAIVEAQESQVEREPQVLSDMQRFGPEPLMLTMQARQFFSGPAGGISRPIGSTITMLLRGLMEEALGQQDLNLVKTLDQWLVLMASRYGYTRDC